MKKHRIGIYTNPSVSYADSSLEKGAYEIQSKRQDLIYLIYISIISISVLS